MKVRDFQFMEAAIGLPTVTRGQVFLQKEVHLEQEGGEGGGGGGGESKHIGENISHLVYILHQYKTHTHAIPSR